MDSCTSTHGGIGPPAAQGSVRVVLVDDHQLMRQGLRSILEEETDIELIGEASCGREGIRLAEQLGPRIVIMDVAMPHLDGIEATRRIKARWPEIGVIALSGHDHRQYVMAVLEAGADAYVLKACAFDDLLAAVRAVRDGKRFLCPEVAGLVVEQGVGRGEAPAARGPAAVLAPREREVLQWIARGLTSGEIAERLSVAISTVDTHRRNLMRKLGLHKVADITRYAIREGLASADA